MRKGLEAVITGPRALAYEKTTGVQYKGMQAMLRAAQIQPAGVLVHASCRNGDSTLAIAEAAQPNSFILGIEELTHAVIAARLKWGQETLSSLDPRVTEVMKHMPHGWVGEFRTRARKYQDKVRFEVGPVEQLPRLIGTCQADMITGLHLLHVLTPDTEGIPSLEVMRAMANCLREGGTFIAGTTNRFLNIDPSLEIEGLTQERYAVDHNPLLRKVYEKIADAVEKETRTRPVLPTAAPPAMNLERLKTRFKEAGLKTFEVGYFLVTVGHQTIYDQMLVLRPLMLEGLWGTIQNAQKREEIAIDSANQARRELAGVDLGSSTNIYDALCFVKAVK